MFLGGIGFLLLANAIGPNVSFVDLWPGMVLMGITNGMVNPLLNTAGLEGIAPQEMGMASGLLNVFRQIGITVGVVGLGLVQDTRYESYLNGHLGSINMPAKTLHALKEALISAGPFSGHGIAFSERLSRALFAQDFQRIVVHAYDNGTSALSLGAAGIAIVGGLAAALLLRNREKSTEISTAEEDK